jgi:hypothetical protein
MALRQKVVSILMRSLWIAFTIVLIKCQVPQCRQKCLLKKTGHALKKIGARRIKSVVS